MVRGLISFLFVSLSLFGNEFDFFDESAEVHFTQERKSEFNSRLRLMYENNFDGENEKKSLTIYQNIKGKNFYVDYDFSSTFDDYRFNLKEIYYKRNLTENFFLDVGRVNVREGIARAYNATDYFKGSGLVFDSLVAGDRQENRLGSVLLQGTLFSDGNSYKFIYSPKITTKASSILSDRKHIGMGLDISNYANRFSLYSNLKLHKKLSTSFIVHKNEEGLNVGTNISYSNGSWIFYNESSFKHAKNTVAISIGKLGLSKEVQDTFNHKEKNIYQGSFGLSYTSQNNIVSTFEYIVNSGGLDKQGWKDFFSLSKQNKRFEQQLLGVRKYHQVNEEMMSKESLFAHIRFNDVTPKLDTHLLAFANPYDKSMLLEMGLEYEQRENLMFKLNFRKMFGDAQSEYGSLANGTVGMAELEYYF